MGAASFRAGEPDVAQHAIGCRAYFGIVYAQGSAELRGLKCAAGGGGIPLDRLNADCHRHHTLGLNWILCAISAGRHVDRGILARKLLGIRLAVLRRIPFRR
jgi:hypothetical protein